MQLGQHQMVLLARYSQKRRPVSAGTSWEISLNASRLIMRHEFVAE